MTLADINWPLILAGLGLFLFGIDYMGDGLKSYAGDLSLIHISITP